MDFSLFRRIELGGIGELLDDSRKKHGVPIDRHIYTRYLLFTLGYSLISILI